MASLQKTLTKMQSTLSEESFTSVFSAFLIKQKFLYEFYKRQLALFLALLSFQGERGEPGPQGERGYPGPAVMYNICLHTEIAFQIKDKYMHVLCCALIQFK